MTTLAHSCTHENNCTSVFCSWSCSISTEPPGSSPTDLPPSNNFCHLVVHAPGGVCFSTMTVTFQGFRVWCQSTYAELCNDVDFVVFSTTWHDQFKVMKFSKKSHPAHVVTKENWHFVISHFSMRPDNARTQEWRYSRRKACRVGHCFKRTTWPLVFTEQHTGCCQNWPTYSGTSTSFEGVGVVTGKNTGQSQHPVGVKNRDISWTNLTIRIWRHECHTELTRGRLKWLQTPDRRVPWGSKVAFVEVVDWLPPESDECEYISETKRRDPNFIVKPILYAPHHFAAKLKFCEAHCDIVKTNWPQTYQSSQPRSLSSGWCGS